MKAGYNLLVLGLRTLVRSLAFRIRPMQETDTPFIHRGLVETNWQDIPDDQKSVLTRAECDERIIQDFERFQKTKRFKFKVFVAVRQANVPVGYVSVAELMNPAVGLPMGGILDLYVEPTLRNRGIGKGLLDYAIRLIRRQGYSHACILVAALNETAKSLYEREGFYADRITMTEYLREP